MRGFGFLSARFSRPYGESKPESIAFAAAPQTAAVALLGAGGENVAVVDGDVGFLSARFSWPYAESEPEYVAFAASPQSAAVAVLGAGRETVAVMDGDVGFLSAWFSRPYGESEPEYVASAALPQSAGLGLVALLGTGDEGFAVIASPLQAAWAMPVSMHRLVAMCRAVGLRLMGRAGLCSASV